MFDGLHESDDVFFIVGEFGADEGVDVGDRGDVLGVGPFELTNLKAVWMTGEEFVLGGVYAENGEVFGQIGEVYFGGVEGRGSHADQPRAGAQFQHSLALEESLSHIWMFVPIVEHNNGSIPDCASMA
jgi:hypothetical protein